MGKILVENEYLEKIRVGYALNHGQEGSCYLLEDKIITKLFHVYLNWRQIYFTEEKSLYIAFPIDILIDSCSSFIAGYTMNYLMGEKFLPLSYPSGLHSNLLLSDLKEAYKTIKSEIEKFKDIDMVDLCLENILFDYQNKKFNLIDTSRWYPKEDNLNRNLETFNWQLMYALCKGSLDWVNNPLNQDKKLNELYCMHQFGNQSLPMDFLEELEIKISEQKGEKVKTIGCLEPKPIKNLIF